LSDRFAPEGAPLGTYGFVIETFRDGAYMVEVSDEFGVDIALFVARDEDLELAEPAPSTE
jgi:hypothetical protein